MKTTISFWMGILFFFIALPVITVYAFPANASIDGPDSISMLEGMTHTIMVDINNGDFHEQDVIITTKTSSKFVKAKPVIKSFELPPYTHTSMGIDITTTSDADHDEYDVIITVDVGGQKMDVPVTVYVGSNPFLTLTTYEKNVCANEYVDEISVSVKNSTSAQTDVSLRAEQFILFPFVDEETLSLDSGESQFVTFNVNVSPPNVGEYDGTILAETNDIVMVRPFSVKVNDCPEPVEKTVSITVPKVKDLVKQKTTLVPVTVKNLTKTMQEVAVFTTGIIPSETQSLFMGPHSTAIVNVPLTPDLSIAAGTYAIQFSASASGYTASQTVNAKVLPIDWLELENASNVFSIAKGATKEMSVVLSNMGDSTQSVGMEIQDSIPGITFTFSPQTISLAPGKTNVVKVTIHASETTDVESVNTFIVANGSKSDATLPLAFDITSTPSSNEGLIQIVAHPEYIETVPDAQKEIVIALYNPTNEAISDIHFKLVGVKGSNITIVQEKAIVLSPHETQTVSLFLVTQENTPIDTYTPILVVESPTAVSSVAFELNVMNPGLLSMFTGFFLFLGDKAVAIGLIILIAILALWLHTRTHKQPVWAQKNKGNA